MTQGIARVSFSEDLLVIPLWENDEGKPGVVVHFCNPSTWKTEAEGTLT